MNFKFQPWDLDQWFSTQGSLLKYDKLEHILLSVIGVLVSVFVLEIEILLALSLMFLLGIAWEIRDGLINNGQGFSIKDLIADFFGILTGYFLIILF